MTGLKIGREDLERFVPHAGRLCLLSGVASWADTMDSLVCVATADESNVFYDPDLGGVPSVVAFEYMAQSISALSGLERFLKGNVDPRIGFIMGVRGFSASCETLPSGKPMKINVRELFRDGPVVSFECNVESEGETIASGTINAYEPER